MDPSGSQAWVDVLNRFLPPGVLQELQGQARELRRISLGHGVDLASALHAGREGDPHSPVLAHDDLGRPSPHGVGSGPGGVEAPLSGQDDRERCCSGRLRGADVQAPGDAGPGVEALPEQRVPRRQRRLLG